MATLYEQFKKPPEFKYTELVYEVNKDGEYRFWCPACWTWYFIKNEVSQEKAHDIGDKHAQALHDGDPSARL